MSKKIMILGASILQLPAIQKAKEMGLSVIAVDMNPDAVGFQEEGVVREVISTIDIPAVVEAAKRHGIDGIMTLASDMPIRSVAAVAKEMNLVSIDDETAVRATNKAEMRKALYEQHVPVPRFFKVSSQQGFEAAVEQFQSAFIIKPADNSGSRGIFKMEVPVDRQAAADAYLYSRQFSRSGDIVVEEYMRGPEISVETLSIDGECHIIQITDKMTTGAPHFVEMGHTQPTQLSPELQKQVAQVTAAANQAIGIQNGPSHTEIIITDEGPKIVELGARLGGDCITTHLVPLSTGVNMVECCIRIALGEKPDITPRFAKSSAIRYFDQHAGVIRHIGGVEEAKRLKGVQQISIVHGIGEHIREINSSGDRIGFVIAQGVSVDEAVQACEAAKAMITVDISPV